MSDRHPPNKVVPFKRNRKKRQGEGELFALLSRIDDLENALEVMDESGVTTREELEALIGQLESEAAALDDADPDS